MVYLCTDLIAPPGAVVQTTRVGTAWSKISGLQPELAYLARAQVIVGSNPTRPTTGSGSGAKLRSTVLVHAALGGYERRVMSLRNIPTINVIVTGQ